MIAVLALLPACVTPSPHDTTVTDPCQAQSVASPSTAEIEQRLDREVFILQAILEELFTHRAVTLTATAAIDRSLQQGQEPPAAELDRVAQATRRSFLLLDGLAAIARTAACLAPPESEAISGATTVALLPVGPRVMASMLTLSASLAIVDTYATTLAVMQQDVRIRESLSRIDLGQEAGSEPLLALQGRVDAIQDQVPVAGALGYFEAHRREAGEIAAASKPVDYLELSIEQSPSYPRLRDSVLHEVLGYRLVDRVRRGMGDMLEAFRDAATGGTGMLVGNALGMVESRKGRMIDDDAALASLSAILQPGDILLEKTPFRLTDRFIPGYWGHAAMWLGSADQLAQLGLWEHPVVARHHAAIQAGRSVAEALRPGVQLNSLQDFLNIDDLVVLRFAAERADLRDSLVSTLEQIGKPYDFNYDINTTDRITCTQLVYLTYPEIDWTGDRLAGRHETSPDNIAVQALRDGPLQIVTLYRDGTPIAADLVADLTATLDSH